MGFEGNVLTLLSIQTCMTLFLKNYKYILKIVMVSFFHEVEVKGAASRKMQKHHKAIII